MLDLDHAVGAALRTARDLLLAEVYKTSGPHKRRLKAIVAAVSDALGVP